MAVASDVKVTDANSRQVLTERHFDLNPSDNKGQHNYTGYPQYNAKGPNALFTSNDAGYQYTTELSDSSSAVEFTYNSLHLLISQKVLTASGPGGLKTSQTQVYCYPVYCPPKMTSWTSLPANYAKPTSVAVTYGDPSHKPNRTVTTSSAYNDEGLQTSATNAAGTTTATTYNSYGLPVTQTVTGTDGSTSITTDTFTDDGKSVQTVSTATGPSANAATARTVATYSYNGYGQVTGESLAWAPGAKPKDDSDGPDQVDTSQQISFDTAAHTQTDVFTTAAGTPDAASTKTVTDLVTGNVLSRTTPGNAIGTDLTTSYTYDALGRQLTSTAPGGQVTTTFHDSPTVTTVTAPSGLKTQTTTDALGRTVKVTDNVSGQKLVASPTARTVQTDHYSLGRVREDHHHPGRNRYHHVRSARAARSGGPAERNHRNRELQRRGQHHPGVGGAIRSRDSSSRLGDHQQLRRPQPAADVIGQLYRPHPGRAGRGNLRQAGPGQLLFRR